MARDITGKSSLSSVVTRPTVGSSVAGAVGDGVVGVTSVVDSDVEFVASTDAPARTRSKFEAKSCLMACAAVR